MHGLLLTSETLASDPKTNTTPVRIIGERIRIVAHRLTDGEPQWEITAPFGSCAAAGGTLALEEDDGLVGYRP